MGVINRDDIRGIRNKDYIECKKCFTMSLLTDPGGYSVDTSGDWSDIKEEDVINNKMIDDTEDIYFCDRCGGRL